MKTFTKISTSFIILSLFAACSKSSPNNPVMPPPDDGDSVKTNPPTTTAYKKTQIDSIRNILLKSPIYSNVISDSVWKDSSGVTFFYKYTAGYFWINDNNENAIFPAAALSMSDLQNEKYNALSDYPKISVMVTNGNTTNDFIDSTMIPTWKNIEGIRNKYFTVITQNEDAGGGQTSFTRYSEFFFSPFPGASNGFFNPLSSSDIIGVAANAPDTIQKKTGVAISFFERFYNLFIDNSQHTTNNENNYGASDGSKAIIDNVVYGLYDCVFLESDTTNEVLTSAIRTLGNGTNTSADDDILKHATSRAFYKDEHATNIDTNVLNGYDRLQEFYKVINASKNNSKGVPLYFTAVVPKDNTADNLQKDYNRHIDFSLK